MNNTALDTWSFVFVVSAGGVYLAAFLSFVADIAKRAGANGSAGRSARVGSALTWLGLGVHGLGVLLRGLSVGTLPWANMYEFSITATFLIVLVYSLVSLKISVRFLGAFITGFVILALVAATILFYVPGKTLAPALQSYWLGIHVLVAMLATAFFALGAGLAVLQLLKARRERATAAESAEAVADTEPAANTVAESLVAEPAVAAATTAGAVASAGAATIVNGVPVTDAARGVKGGKGIAKGESGAAAKEPSRWRRLLASLPSSEDLETLSYRLNIVGFILWTFTLIFGAIWAQHAWGRFWGWDVKEVWTFVIWVIFAGYLHARATRGWRGDRAAWLALAGFIAVIFNFTIVNVFFKGLHAYSGL